MANRRVAKAKKEVESKRAAELLRIYHEHQELRPSVVVTEAKPKTSPLHGHFEWDDGKAGTQYRLQQARVLIRVVKPMIERDGQEVADPFVHVPTESSDFEGTYHPMSVVVRDSDAFARALSELVTRVRAAQSAAEELKAAAQGTDNPDGERMARIAMAITALQTAGAAVSALH